MRQRLRGMMILSVHLACRKVSKTTVRCCLEVLFSFHVFCLLFRIGHFPACETRERDEAVIDAERAEHAADVAVAYPQQRSSRKRYAAAAAADAAANLQLSAQPLDIHETAAEGDDDTQRSLGLQKCKQDNCSLLLRSIVLVSCILLIISNRAFSCMAKQQLLGRLHNGHIHACGAMLGA